MRFIALAGFLAISTAAPTSNTNCAHGLKLFIARGTGEKLGSTVMDPIAQKIAERVLYSDTWNIPYPATFNNPQYIASAGNGTTMVREALEEYSNMCPNSKMALMGWSRGAQIISNNLCGTPAAWRIFWGQNVSLHSTSLEPLSDEIRKKIVAVVLFGDPTHRGDASYARGNVTGNGIFYRNDYSDCEALGTRIRDYCLENDPYCDSGYQADPDVHYKYFEMYKDEVVEYVKSLPANGGVLCYKVSKGQSLHTGH
ncbi:acetylxylan esterase [Fusarium pseudocircinatum]|uniref:Acetylxylan esterase n=1 Tax=Fusarium pseudocircinatum TaxID=56676 RepID=A0A8H5L161_9HYPO|nr:acetylxylan esterase [Fusarium pseudocircinatum]